MDQFNASRHKRAVLMAVLAAVLYALSAPFAKLLLAGISPVFMAALLYIGAGLGMGILSLILERLPRQDQRSRNAPLNRNDLPAVLGMILLDVAAPILLLLGLERTTAANASLLNNFEIVATSLIAMLFFKEAISRRLGIAIVLVTTASVILSFESGGNAFLFSVGSLLVLGASICWGIENNLTRELSVKDPLQVVVVKGFGSGLGSFWIAVWLGELSNNWLKIGMALVLGFVAYGLSIYFYVRAQRDLGAAKTSAFYAAAPFIGVILSFAIFRTPLSILFLAAFLIMLAGAYLSATDSVGLKEGTSQGALRTKDPDCEN